MFRPPVQCKLHGRCDSGELLGNSAWNVVCSGGVSLLLQLPLGRFGCVPTADSYLDAVLLGSQFAPEVADARGIEHQTNDVFLHFGRTAVVRC